MSEKFEIYNEVINELLGETLSCVPESWSHGSLCIQCDGRKITYQLKNPDEEERASISDDLKMYCEKVYVIFAQNGDTWSEAVFNFIEEDGSWSFKTEFNYSEDASSE